ncbi:hypothetical protein SAMN04490208_4809 [Pseudomonas poae]|uniref:Uncharacterized protein n=1 Tax=Pseudomonas poae TaxID=200451 RepID=A0ABY0S327_9PSED|nr:hypothetical protein SAMN04490208_4809 [Pseudomonas poae]
MGNGYVWFRPYGGSLWKSRNAGPAQSNQRALAPPLGTSLRLGAVVDGAPEIKIKSKADQKQCDIQQTNGDQLWEGACSR